MIRRPHHTPATERQTRRARCAAAGLLAFATAALPRAAAQEADAAAPPCIVWAGVATNYPAVPTRFRGTAFNPKDMTSRHVQREWASPLFPACGTSLVFTVTILSNRADRTFHIEGTITDYAGAELATVARDVPLKAGASALESFAVTPAQAHPGPFYFRGTCREVGGALTFPFEAAAAQPNTRLVIADFEQVQYPHPGRPIESSAEAAHRGRIGLLLRLTQPAPRPAGQPPAAFERLPLALDLPGRPAALGFWIQASAAVRVALELRDPGIEVNQSTRYDEWTVGPVDIEAGDWRYARIPMPGYSRPRAERKEYGEGDGIVDYPLTVNALVFEGASNATVRIDDVEAWTQAEPEQSLRVRAGFDKPEGLLYPDDTLNVMVANGWLWGSGATAAVTLELEDIRGARRSLYSGALTVPPGAEVVAPVPVAQLPLGGYLLRVAASAPAHVATQAVAETTLLVYEPAHGRPAHPQLHELLADRNRLLTELGFTDDIVMIPWHSLDGSPAVEPRMGQWRFDWLGPDLAARRAAGLRLVGRLGFTPEWAGTEAMWNVKMNAWYGNSTVMPARSAYWEEYVLRSAEHFAGQIGTWIVWERPDSGALGATPEEYAEQLVEVASRAAREANPDARIISGGVTRENIERYLLALSETGVSRTLDGIGILPTSAPLSPEDGDLAVVLARAQRIRAQEQLTPELQVLNLDWATGEGQYRVSEFDQARYVARAYAICRSQGITNIHLQADGPPELTVRDSAFFIYRAGPLFAPKPAALAARTVRAELAPAAFLREVPLNDRRDDIARCYLFRRPDGALVMAAWRREGESTLPLPRPAERIIDLFGNGLPVADGTVRLTPEPVYVTFRNVEAEVLARGLERANPVYEDTAASAWKRELVFHLDVGDAADEQAAGYRADGRPTAPLDSYYHTDHGRHLTDSGRAFGAEQAEQFSVKVSGFGDSALILRRRLDFMEPNQRLKVYCAGQYVGQWFTWKSDPRYRWRDTEFIVPNRFFAGQPAAELRLVAQGPANSYAYSGGPLKTHTLYVSDLSPLVATSGYGAGALRDKNILGGRIAFYRRPGETFEKGIGTMAAATPGASLFVIGLNQQYARFRALVGVDAAAGGRGSVRFRVSLGTSAGLETVFDSQDMTYYSEPQEVDLDVSAGIVLMLWAGDAGDGNEDDLADWADARLDLK